MTKVVSILSSALILLTLFVFPVCPFAESAGSSDMVNPYLILVNKEHKLPDDWNFRVEFDVGKNSLGELYIVECETLRQFEALRAHVLEEEGVQMELDSTYRALWEQQDIWDYWMEEYGLEYCEQYLAPVGCSEHHTGLAIDVFLIKDGESIRDNDAMIADTEDFAKIHKHLAEHGFILRYLEGKEDITGYSYEPWHFRYVGVPTAKAIMKAGVTLEEYLAE